MFSVASLSAPCAINAPVSAALSNGEIEWRGFYGGGWRNRRISNFCLPDAYQTGRACHQRAFKYA
jgi:hypothetical protein